MDLGRWAQEDFRVAADDSAEQNVENINEKWP
jgi:endogenous inhibitor of DNA gyrase (YacG/DUF329 family)